MKHQPLEDSIIGLICFMFLLGVMAFLMMFL